MKMNYDEFMLRFLRPAIFNGEELELEVEFEKASMYSVNINNVKALRMPVGDTVCIGACVHFAESDTKTHGKFFTIYMSGDELTKFINKFGTRDICGKVKMRVKHVYVVLEKENYTDTEYEEIIGFELLSLI